MYMIVHKDARIKMGSTAFLLNILLITFSLPVDLIIIIKSGYWYTRQAKSVHGNLVHCYPGTATGFNTAIMDFGNSPLDWGQLRKIFSIDSTPVLIGI